MTVLRTLRALMLFWGLIASYGITWLLGRLFGDAERRFTRAHEIGAKRLLHGFSSLGGVFIKAGQMLSVVGTFLPPAYVQSLEKLQDRVLPRPFSQVRRRLEVALGPKALTRFKHISRRPIAAASLAQVHKALAWDGQELAIKILYPDIEEWIKRDLWVLRTVLPVARWMFPIAHAERILEQLEAMLNREIQYGEERANLEKMRRVFEGDADVVIPRVFPELSGPGVLCMSYESGIKLTNADALAQAGLSGESVARRIVDCYFTMLFEHRLFHADPHPGNFLARPGNKGAAIVLLDFGAVEQLSDPLALGMKEVLIGALTKNDDTILSGLATMGFVAEGGDRELLRRVGKEYLAILGNMNLVTPAQLGREHLEKLGGFDALRGKLRNVMRHVQYPDGYFYVERTMVLLFGLIGQLAPQKGLFGMLLPYAPRVMARASGMFSGRAQSAASKKPSATHPSDPSDKS